jgi:hypothetical protein
VIKHPLTSASSLPPPRAVQLCQAPRGPLSGWQGQCVLDDLSRRFSNFPLLLSYTCSVAFCKHRLTRAGSLAGTDNACLLNDLDFLQNKMPGKSNVLLS